MNSKHQLKSKQAWPACPKSVKLKQKSRTCEEGGGHFRNYFWHLLMNFEKPEKSEFWKNEKKLKNKKIKNAGDTIILQNHNHMRYSYWNTK